MQGVVGKLEELGATLLAVTPQLAEQSQEMIEQHELTYDVLSDPGNQLAAKFGLKFTLPDEIKELYSGFGIDLPANQGGDGWTLPMPGRFVIDSKGTIRAADVDPDYTVRPEPQATVELVASL